MARLGLISYLNTAPYRFGLKRLGEPPWTEALPSQMVAQVQSGDLEAAIMPAFDVLSHPELVVLPGLGIACVGQAYSVKLFHRVPLRFAETVALDTSSHTSAALTRIILEQHGAHPKFLDAAPDLARMLSVADVALVIGDPCLQADASDLLVTDLGEEWERLTGRPFVFALWGARPEGDSAGLTTLLTRAVDLGLADLEAVAQEEAGRAGLASEGIVQYLRDYMRYHLDDTILAGLEQYRQMLVERKLIADVGPVPFARE